MEETIKYQAMVDLKGDLGIRKFLWTDEKKFLITKKTLEKAQEEGKCKIISIGRETKSNIKFYSNQKIINEKLSYPIGKTHEEQNKRIKQL